jgi:hypothetical protein
MRVSIRQRRPGEVAPPVRKGTIRIRVVGKSPLVVKRPVGLQRVRGRTR